MTGRPHPFRFEKRKARSGHHIYYVYYDTAPTHPRSTGVRVRTEDARASERIGYGNPDAVAWAYEHLARPTAESVTVGRFVADFFTDADPWVRLERSKGRELTPHYLGLRRGMILNYVLPQWRSFTITRIRPSAIDNWLLELESTRDEPLAPATKDRMVWIMRHIFRRFMYEYPEALTTNPAELITPFDHEDASAKRRPFELNEIETLFPNDYDRCLQIWGDLRWYAYFLMQWTCGLRPGETAGFMLSDWRRDLHGALISRTIHYRTLEVTEGLKTRKKGMAVKPVVFSERLEAVLQLFVDAGDPEEDLLFRSVNGKPLYRETANKHLRASAKRAGVVLAERTQYSFRHTYYTELLKRLPEKEVARMAGHRSLRKEYDHRQGIDFLRAAEPLREVVNSLSA